MRRIAVVDAETDPFKRARIPAPFIWGFYDGTQYRTFRDTEKLVDFLKGEDCICFAHNGGRFDWHFILPYLEPYEEIGLINGRIARFDLGECECRDSYNLLPIPLSAYKKDDMDYRIMEAGERDKPANREKIEAYLRSDCVYLWDLISQFVDRYGLQITQASASMKQWKKISGREPPNTSREFYETFAPYYYGGRVECFESGVIDTDFSVYDINSAYPYAMLQKHPFSDNYSERAGYAKNADFFEVACISSGAFPYREDGTRGGLSFPCDDRVRRFTISRWEYDSAIETKTIRRVKVIKSITFCEHQDFGDYVNHFYAERAKCKASGDLAGSLFAKLFMNSLYGKFAANPDHYRDYMIVPMEVICALGTPGSTVADWRFSGEFGPWGLAEKDIDPHRSRYYNVATGASITGYVRAMLWRALCGAVRPLYCDTDSIAAGSLDVPLGDDLGAWKHEGDFDRAGIAGKKLYVFRGVPGSGEGGKGRLIKMAAKGARLTEGELWRVARGGIVAYESETPTFSTKRAPGFVSRDIRKTA